MLKKLLHPLYNYVLAGGPGQQLHGFKTVSQTVEAWEGSQRAIMLYLTEAVRAKDLTVWICHNS